jgi:hypothetical protein
MHISIYFLVIGIFSLIIGLFFSDSDNILFQKTNLNYDPIVRRKITKIRYFTISILMLLGSVTVYFKFEMLIAFVILVLVLPVILVKVYLKTIN